MLETLEGRRLLAFTGGAFDLPVLYDFSAPANGVADRNGANTGFPIVQGNRLGNELDASLLELDRQAGVLRVTSSGDAQDGSNFGTDNTLVNGLQLPFDGSGGWLVHTRVGLQGGGLDNFDTAFEQAGLLVGPGQDDYVKLVFTFDGQNRAVQFLAEEGGPTLSFPLGNDGVKANVSDTGLASVPYIDLWLSGDAETREIGAQYRLAGGSMVRFDETYAAPEALFRTNATRAGLIAAHKNDVGPITAEFELFEVTQAGLPSTRPGVQVVRPAEDADDVFRDAFVAVDLDLPNASVDASTLTAQNVRLERVSDGRVIEARRNTSGGGDVVILVPQRALDADTEYRFVITDGVRDILGNPFVPFTSTFRTNFSLGGEGGDLGGVAFEQVPLPSTQGTIWSSVTIGPDNRLYATAIDGLITRFDILDDGTLGSSQDITSLNDAENGPRIITGLTFAPDATADSLVAYVSHTQFNDVTTSTPDTLGEDFTGKLSRLSGPALGTVADLVTGLPRSIRDHLNNQPVFGPDGRIYFGQGANTAMGAPDPAWGFREEQVLSGAVLAVDVNAIEAAGTPLDVRTGSAGNYNPDAAGAPVTIFAEGVRNTYDLVFHSNGSIYAPTNGSAAGGNTPANPDGSAVGLTDVRQTQSDYLFRLEPGRYYGHPNVNRGNFVLNGGNPTSGNDPAQVNAYPVGTQPESDWAGFAYDFGLNQSPNGAVEYRASDAFGGALDGKLIITRFSGGNDLIVLDVNADGSIGGETLGIPGFTGLSDPLDLAQRANGDMYVAEFGSQRITLLRAVAEGGQAKEQTRRIFADVEAGGSVVRPFVVRNDGDQPLVVNPYTLGLTGPDKDLFEFVDAPTLAVAVQPGESAAFPVRFNAPADAPLFASYEATAFVRTSDPNAPEVGTRVIAFIKQGVEGPNEPPLQRIFDLYELGITTGDPNPDDNVITAAQLNGLNASLFRPADPNRPVAFEAIASYSPERDPTLSFGAYQPGRPQTLQKLGEVIDAQALSPQTIAPDKFFADGTFGLYLRSPAFVDPIGGGVSAGRGRVVYSEPALNLWEPDLAERRKVAVWEIEGRDNALAVAFEEWEVQSDYNDLVLVMTNVVPVFDDDARLAATAPASDAGLDRLLFSHIPDDRRDNRFGTQFIRNTRTVPLQNVGDTPLTVTSVTAPTGFSASGVSGTLQPGDEANLTITFGPGVQPNEELFQGDVTVNHTGGRYQVPVSGFFMPYSEDDVASGLQKDNVEPLLPDMVRVLGLSTNVGTEDELFAGGSEPLGDEVISFFWRAAEPDLPVEVYQVAAFHNMNSSDPIFWFPATAQDRNAAQAASVEIFRHQNTGAQTFIPQLQGTASTPAAGSFLPGTQAFGLRVVNEYSPDTFNPENQHRFRFYPAINADGRTIEDTWLVTMDFDGFNFDFNDNVYIVRNMRPAQLARGPVGLSVTPVRDGRAVAHFGQTGSNGVSIFRSDDGGTTFRDVGTVSQGRFFDIGDATDDTVLRVAGRTSGGNPGTFSDVRLS